MALIHILDKQSDKIIGTLNLGEYSDSGSNEGKVSSSENKNTFDFTALKKFDLLQKRNRLLLQDRDGFFSEYIIIYAEQNSRNQKFIKSNATFTDLQKAKIIEPQVLQGATADTVTTKALEGTEWRKGKVDYNGIRTIKIEEYTNPYSLLKRIASEFGLDLRFRVAVEGNKIVRYVDLTLPDDEFDGKEVVFGKDLISLRRIEDAQNIVTALLVLGPEQEDGTRQTVLVEDNDALQRWGRNGQHLIEVYEPQITAEEVTVERLRTLGENALQKKIDAIVTYECQAAILEDIPGKEHEKVRLDSTIRIKDEGYTPPLYVEAKVLEIKEQPSTGKILDFKLGNYKEFSKADLEAQIAGLKKLLAQKASNAKLVETYELALQQAEEKAAQAEENAKGYTDTVKVQVVEHANTVANQAENNAKSHADTVAGEAESNAKAYALSEANKAKIAAIQAAATDAQTKVNAAKTALEASIAEKADAEWVNGQLVSKADKANTYTKTEVDNALNSKVSITQYTADMNGVVTRLNSAESRITQTEQEIATKVSNTTYQLDKTTINNNISQLQTRMSNAETAITQNANQIALKANKTDVYTKTETDGKITTAVNNAKAEIKVTTDSISQSVSSLQSTVNSQGTRLSSAESSITSLSTQIQSKVSMTDVSMALGDLSNYASWDKSNANEFPLNKGSRDTTVYRTFLASIKLAPGEVAAEFKKPKLPVQQGEKIYYEFWVKTDSGWNGKTDNSKLRFGDQNGKLLSAYSYTGAKTTWTKYSGIFVVPSGVTSLIISFGNDGTSGNVWIDDVILAKQSYWDSLLVRETSNLTTRLSTAESTITQQAGLIASKAESSTVTALGTRVTTAEQNINGLTGEINQRVKTTDYNGNTIASLINQTATTIKLQASKIDLVGAVTVLSDITGNLGNITAGTIRGVNIIGSTFTAVGSNNASVNIDSNGWYVKDETGKVKICVTTKETDFAVRQPSAIQFFTGGGSRAGYVGMYSEQDVMSLYSGTRLIITAPEIEIYGYKITFDGDGGKFRILANNIQSAVWWDNNVVCGWSYWSSAWWRFNWNTKSFEATNYAGTAFMPITASGWNTASKAEFKTDIKKWEESALEKIRNTTIYEYRLKEDESRTVRQGVVIGEGYQLDPSLVDKNETIDQYRMTSWSWKAIQELDSEQQIIKDRVAWLETENSYLKQKIKLLEEKIA